MKSLSCGRTGRHLFHETTESAALTSADGQNTIQEKQNMLVREQGYGRSDERTEPGKFV